MLERMRAQITSAHLIALLALFVALGGTGYAAVKLPKNSVGGTQLKKNAVSSAKVKDGSLLKDDFKAGQLPAGATGPQGPKGADGKNGTNGTNGTNGADGADGEADAFARVQADGTLEAGSGTGSGPAQFKGLDPTDIQKAGTGIYCFGDLDFPIASAVVAMDNAGAAATTTQVASVAIQRGANLGSCDAGHQQARVVITNVDPGNPSAAAQDGRFEIWFEK